LADDHVGLFIQPFGNVGKGDVGQAHQDGTDLLLKHARILLKPADLIPDLAHLGNDVRRRFLTGATSLAHLAANLVTPRPQLVSFGDGLPPVGVQRQKLAQRVFLASGFQGALYEVRVSAYQFDG